VAAGLAESEDAEANAAITAPAEDEDGDAWEAAEYHRGRAEGALESTLQVVGRQTHAQVVSLMKRGYQQHEAEEVALAEHVLLPPEEAAKMEPWERAELAALEKDYQGRAA
jgi:hypothetical protein